MKVLCTGDVHIGRRSSRVPMRLDNDGRKFTGISAWESVVSLAIEEKVDLVIISGDLVDEQNRFYEAIGAVERGLERLGEADIEVVAVAGNHDWDVLPRLVDSVTLPHVHFLGRRGTWERRTVERPSGKRVHIDGWSFPERYVRAHPLSEMLPDPGDGVPVLAVIHGDLDGIESPYNPLPRGLLQQSRVTCWILGHIHRPQWIAPVGNAPGILYPGSPYALAPNEGDVHGAWLATISPDTLLAPRLEPISRVRYVTLRIDATGLDTRDTLEPHVIQMLRADLATQAAQPAARCLECVCYRVEVHGRTCLHRDLSGLMDAMRADLELSYENASAVIDTVIVETRPAVDLEEIARSKDLTGELASLILGLEASDTEALPEIQALLSNALQAMHRVANSRAYSEFTDTDTVDLQQARQLLTQEAWTLLDALLSQKAETI